jgi:hypothetical protein
MAVIKDPTVLDALIAVAVENPMASMLAVVATVVACYAASSIYSQHREEMQMRAALDRLRRERDELMKDL